jgi:hypothetical protein
MKLLISFSAGTAGATRQNVSFLPIGENILPLPVLTE